MDGTYQPCILDCPLIDISDHSLFQDKVLLAEHLYVIILLMKHLRILSLFVLFLLVVSCQGTVATDPVREAESTLVDKSKGNVTGILISKDKVQYRGLLIYLGTVINGPEGFVASALDTKNAPSTVVNAENGTFAIQNVKPGEYSLIVYEVEAGGKALLDGQGNIKVIEVLEGSTFDVGTINLDELNISLE